MDIFSATASITRPENTTAYAIGDAVSNSTSAAVAMSFKVGNSNHERAVITKVQVISDVKAATLPMFNLWLFRETVVATNDNAALSVTDASVQTGPSVIALNTQWYTAINSIVEATNIQVPVILERADMNLYGLLQATNAYTPASAEVLTVIIEGYLVR